MKKIKIITVFFVLFCTCLLNNKVYGQGDPPGLKIIPPSPNAAALGKFAEIPVNYYTGSPNISIPIWELKGRDLSVPISLSYHPSGIKVEEIASWVGLGWSLNAGGVITRTMKSLPDEMNQIGYYHSGNFQNGTFQPSSEDDFFSWVPTDATLHETTERWLDTEPDVFYFNFNGYSGKFFFDGNGGIIFSPVQKFKITPTINIDIISWEIVTPDGTKYIFGTNNNYERTEQISWCTGASAPNILPPFNSSWYLTEIISPKGDDIITFSYTDENYSYMQNSNEELLWDFLVSSFLGTSDKIVCNNGISFNGKRLLSITSAQGQVDFIANQQRTELAPTKRLDLICIYGVNSELIKKFAFDYSYFNSGSGRNQGLRLKLDQVTELYDESNKKPPYNFSYNYDYNSGIRLPDRDSKKQDHWGYYNGAQLNDNINSLIPTVELGAGIYNGANREPNASYISYCVLNKIEYPTGGYSEFEYEPHDYAYVSNTSNRIIDYVESYAAVEINSNDCDPYWTSYYPTIDTIWVSHGQYPNINYYFSSTVSHDFHTRVKVLDINEQLIWEEVFSSGQQVGNCIIKEGTKTNLFLSAGYYILKTESLFTEMYAKLDIVWEKETVIEGEATTVGNSIASGLRIKRMTYHDGITQENDIIKKFNYRMQSDPDLSSGVILSKPGYFVYADLQWITPDRNTVVLTNEATPYLKLYSTTQVPVGLTQGSIVGYKEVEIIHGENGENGKTIYKYVTPYDHPDRLDFTFPFPLRESQDWKRGFLKEVINYNSNELIRTKDTYSYNPIGDPLNRKVVRGFRSQYTWRGVFILNGNGFGPPRVYNTDQNGYIYGSYKVISGWNYQTEKASYTYDKNGQNPLIKTTYYEYGNPDHIQLTKTSFVNSKDDLIETSFYYPHDYYGTAPYTEMVNDHNIINPIIKTEIKVAQTQVSGSKTNYPEPFTDFLPSTTEIWEKGNGYKTNINFDSYDTYGNLKQYHKENGLEISYFWGYNNTFPVAKIIGIEYNVIPAGAISELEKLDDATVDLDQVNSNIRSSLPDCMVTTYTYKPMVGIKTETDPAGKTVYYDYDSFGRLVTIKDQDGVVLKHFKYNYANDN